MAESDGQVLGEETPPLESKASADEQAAARKLGWIPPERYKGDPEKFVDADVFVKRGEEVLPIVKQRNAKLEGQVGRLTDEVTRLKEIIEANQEAMKALEEYHTGETRRKVAEVRKSLKAEIARASEEGDHTALAEAADQLSQLNEKADETEGTRKAAPPPATKLEPFFTEWADDTGWYGKDRRRTALANAVAVELRQAGETAVGRDFLDLIAEEVERELPPRRPNPDKVNGGRPRGGGGSGGKTYSDLPAEAKAACDSFAKQLVGEGRRFKTNADWRAKYAKDYFEEA